MELLEAGVRLCSPRVVAIADVDAILLPNTLVWWDVLGARFVWQIPIRLLMPLHVERGAPRGVIRRIIIRYPQEAATVHKGGTLAPAIPANVGAMSWLPTSSCEGVPSGTPGPRISKGKPVSVS